MEQAVLKTFCPETVDRMLRNAPHDFESLRNNYKHPREYKAYTLLNIKEEEILLSDLLGFNR